MAEALARQAGTQQVEVKMIRTDQRIRAAVGWGHEVYLGTRDGTGLYCCRVPQSCGMTDRPASRMRKARSIAV